MWGKAGSPGSWSSVWTGRRRGPQEEEPCFVSVELELSGNYPSRDGSKVWLSGVIKMQVVTSYGNV